MSARRLIPVAVALLSGLLSGCATKAPAYDYAAFTKAKPATLLVLPPVNESPDLKATPSVWSHTTQPLAEAGYYVLPVTLVDETLRQNGITTASDAQEIPVNKLRDFFGADAAVYIKVKQYGTTYSVISSEARVQVEGRVVDLRTGELLWSGKAFASSAEQQTQAQGGLAGLLIAAIVRQVVGTATDESYRWSGVATARLLGTPVYNGILPGPRSPMAGKPPAAQGQ